MTVSEATGAREFHVDFAGQLPGAPFQGPGELVIETIAPEDRPIFVKARFYVGPDEMDLRVRLPRAIKGTPFEPRGLELANAAHTGRLVVEYTAGPQVIGQLTGGLSTLQALPSYLQEAPNVLDFQGYELDGIVVEVQPAAG